MANFNMMDLLNNSSIEKSVDNLSFKTKQININNLVPSKENFYSTKEEDLIELKNSIEIFGVQQNLVVKKTENDKYEIIAGHRRYLALKTLYEEGKEQFKEAPCKVENEEDNIKDKLLLLLTNSTARQLTDWEKTQQAEKLKELLVEYKKKEKLTGRVREIIAEILNTSPTQIARMESISKNLAQDFKEEFKEEKVNISAAYELSKLPKENQEEVYEEYKEKGNITLNDVKKKTVEIKIKEEIPKNEIVSESDTNKNEDLATVNLTTGEIIEQRVPNYFNKKMINFIKELNTEEFAKFLCDRCIGIGGGSGCAGLCDLAPECKGINKYEICSKWLNQKI